MLRQAEQHESVCEDRLMAVNERTMVMSASGTLPLFPTWIFFCDPLMTPALSPWNPQETNFPGTKFLRLCLPSFVGRMTPGHALPRAVCFWMLYWIALRAFLEGMFELWRPSHFPCRLFTSESFHSHTEWEMALEQRRSNDAFISQHLQIDGQRVGEMDHCIGDNTSTSVVRKHWNKDQIHWKTILL